MEKQIYKSKTLWGAAVAGVIGLGQAVGLDLASSMGANVVQVAATVFSVFGLRSALK